MPFILDVATKEKVPELKLIQIDEDVLENALALVREKAPYFQEMKLGHIKAPYCGKCDYCKSILKTRYINSIHDFDPKDYNDYGNEEN